MKIFKSIDDFAQFIGDDPKGLRILKAFNDYKKIEENAYYSIGDSLVFRYMNKLNEEQVLPQSHKRYLDIHYILSGIQKVKIGEASSLKISSSYDDTTDCQVYEDENKLKEMEVGQGNILILEPKDAYKFLDSTKIEKIVVKFTVENKIF